MHELGITRNLVSLCSEHAKGRRVRQVWLEIGTRSGLLPDAVRFCFDVVAKGTPLEGATLTIIEMDPGLHCRKCGGAAPNNAHSCERCGELLREMRGDEINVKAMEVDSEADQPCA